MEYGDEGGMGMMDGDMDEYGEEGQLEGEMMEYGDEENDEDSFGFDNDP